MKKNKKKGYVLAVVMILTFIMTITVTSAFSVVMRYMFFAKNHLQELSGNKIAYVDVWEELNLHAGI